MDMKDLKLNFNIKALLLYERLTGESFFSIDYEDSEQFKKLLYCCLISGSVTKYTYEVFENMINSSKKIASVLMNEFKEIIEFNKQFISDIANQNKNNQSESSKLADIIPILVKDCNLSIYYVMNDMQIQEIPTFINYSNRVKQEDLQLQRFWAYLTILPHTGKKLKSPKDLITFNWEEEEQTAKAQKLTEFYEDSLDDILEKGKNILK